VPNVGGAPGVVGGVAGALPCGSERHAIAAASAAPMGAVIRNCLRVFMATAP
jgi:hypothetical protein